MTRVDRQIASLRGKSDRLREMIEAAEKRRAHLDEHLAELDAGVEPGHPG